MECVEIYTLDEEENKIADMISIILVNYNGAVDTIECIKSIHESEDVEYRIIVVDNSSTDDSVEIIKRASNSYSFELVEVQENYGFSAGNNAGIRRAMELGTDQVLLLNNDTLIEPYTLKRLIDGLLKNENCGLTIGKIFYESERNRIWYAGGSFHRRIAKATHWNYREIDQKTKEVDTEVTFATGCCMCMPIDVIRKVGMMDEGFFLYEEDADYCLRIREAGYKMIYVPEAIIYHKVSSSTGKMTGLAEYYTFRNKCRLIEKHLSHSEKFTAYGYTIIRGIKGYLKGEQDPSILLKAFKAFVNKESGKTEREI